MFIILKKRKFNEKLIHFVWIPKEKMNRSQKEALIKCIFYEKTNQLASFLSGSLKAFTFYE